MKDKKGGNTRSKVVFAVAIGVVAGAAMAVVKSGVRLSNRS